jgi:methionyl-tRNA formyltransferase
VVAAAPRLRLVFCGTPQFAVPTLEAVVAAGHSVELVVTQPDRPSGRGMQLLAPPVKATALTAGLPVMQPDKIKNNLEFRAQLETTAPDAILIVAYGRIIPKWMLDLPRLGNINLHGSLLPKYRGAAPIQWAIASGETVTGNTTMRIDEGLDTGNMLLQREMQIGADETAADLYPRLAQMGAALMVETLEGLSTGTLGPIEQDHSLATLAPILTRDDGQIDFSRTAGEIYNRWRGFQPWPGAWTLLGGKKLTAQRLAPANLPHEISAGQIVVEAGRLYAGCSGGTGVELLEVQMEGKKRMAAAEFLRGYSLKSGDRLGL